MVPIEKYFNPDPKEIETNMKKRGFFINRFNADTSFNSILPNEQISPVKKLTKESTLDNREKTLNCTSSLKDHSIKDLSNQSPEHPTSNANMNKSTTQISEVKKRKMTKLRYTHLKTEISDILEFFNDLIKIETKYGETLSEIGEPKFFNQSVIFLEDKSDKIYTTSDLPPEERLLVIRFLKNKDVKRITLPEWNIFRIGIRAIGKAHKDCAKFIKKGVNDMVYMFNNEYVQEAQKINKERKDVKTVFEKSQTILKKTGEDYKEQHQNFMKLYKIYNEAKIAREAPSLLCKKEGDAKMASLTSGILNDLILIIFSDYVL